MDGFRYDAHPMAMLLRGGGALGTFYPDAKNTMSTSAAAASRSTRLIAQDADPRRLLATATAWACPYVSPDNELSYAGNFLR